MRAGGCGLPEVELGGGGWSRNSARMKWVTGRSRARLAAIFFREKAELVLGRMAWSVRPCQKQPSKLN